MDIIKLNIENKMFEKKNIYNGTKQLPLVYPLVNIAIILLDTMYRILRIRIAIPRHTEAPPWMNVIFLPLGHQAEGVLSLPASVHQSVCLPAREL